jgi:hypothetical protein
MHTKAVASIAVALTHSCWPKDYAGALRKPGSAQKPPSEPGRQVDPELAKKRGPRNPLYHASQAQPGHLPGPEGTSLHPKLSRQAIGACLSSFLRVACGARQAGVRLWATRQRLLLRRLPTGNRRGAHIAFRRAHHSPLDRFPGAHRCLVAFGSGRGKAGLCAMG